MKMAICILCNGQGVDKDAQEIDGVLYETTGLCEYCNGTGKIAETQKEKETHCWSCKDPISTDTHKICSECKSIICHCSACFCKSA
jgi:DnaJ-class molecular chaperone